MHYNISTNLYNGAGLQRDFELLRRILVAAGHTVHGIMFNDYQPVVPPADVTIFIEIVNPVHIFKGSQVWFIPNSEWFLPGFNGTLKHVHKVLCKTHDCYNIWSKKVGAEKCLYIGWEALDLYQPDATRFSTFLHVAGKSATKNTKAILDAWRQYNLPYGLTVVACHPWITPLCKDIPNVEWYERLTDDQLARAMNSNRFHIMPSAYEGYGHALHEAIGCGAVVITVDAPPMNESTGILSELLIKPDKINKFHEAPSYSVSPADVANTVHRAWNLMFRLSVQLAARQSFLIDRAAFQNCFAELIHA